MIFALRCTGAAALIFFLALAIVRRFTQCFCDRDRCHRGSRNAINLFGLQVESRELLKAIAP
jgi:hypothetical protein